MTGFGRSSVETPAGKLTVEIQSINRKYMDVSIALPKEWSRFEPEVRKWVTDASLRGQISIRVYFLPSANGLTDLLPSAETLRNLKQSWDQIASRAGFDSSQVNLPFVMLHFPFQQKIDSVTDENLNFLKKGVHEALSSLKEMKRKEGKVLFLDLETRLEKLEEIRKKVALLAPLAIERMRNKLQEKMKELLQGQQNTEDLLLREVALFAEKIDVTEEIVRLQSHFVQFLETLKSDGFVGKKMDFLIQEIGREINTIGSKSSEIQISHLIVEMKSELEKMREQIQNIE
jgi:uncharacterized protein (TIGR00255 family)